MDAINRQASSRCVVQIENDPIWRDIVARTIKELGGVTYFGSECDVDPATSDLATISNQIIIVEPIALGCDFIGFVDRVAAKAKRCHLVVLTYRIDEFVLSLLRHSFVTGLIWKPICDPSSLAETIRAAALGIRWLQRDVQIAWSNLREQPLAFFKILSNRELRLLPRFGHAESDYEIASATGLAESTVRSHRENIMRKLGLNRAGKLVNWAAARGFVTAQSSEHLTTVINRRAVCNSGPRL